MPVSEGSIMIDSAPSATTPSATQDIRNVLPANPPPSLTLLPPEVLNLILFFLDVPDLLSISRVSHVLRQYALDPHLHHLRLMYASTSLAHYLPHRPPPSALRPPISLILLSRTHIVARAISRSLISIRLSRNLSSRSSPDALISRHILPAECVGYLGAVSPVILHSRTELRKRKLRDGLRGKLERRMSKESLVNANILPGELYRRSKIRKISRKDDTSRSSRPDSIDYEKRTREQHTQPPSSRPEQHEPVRKDEYYDVAISPSLIETRRKVIRESLKDGLRAWIEKRAAIIQRRSNNDEGEIASSRSSILFPDSSYLPGQMKAQQRTSVKVLIQRFTRSIAQQSQPHPSSLNPTSKPKCHCDVHKKNLPSSSRWERPPPPIRHGSGGGGGGGGLNACGSPCSQPTRAHVLSLRRFWEGVCKSGA